MTKPIACVALALMFVNCSSSSEEEEVCTEANATATASVSLQNKAFSPECFKVAQGTAVTFTNNDSVSHTVTSDDGQPESFTGTLASHGTFMHTFNVAGTTKIHCNFHSSMYATAIVTP